MYESDDEDPFPFGTNVETLYPLNHVTGGPTAPYDEWVWMAAKVMDRTGPDEWHLQVLDRRAAELELGVPAPENSGDLLLYHPNVFRDGAEIRVHSGDQLVGQVAVEDLATTPAPPAPPAPAPAPAPATLDDRTVVHDLLLSTATVAQATGWTELFDRLAPFIKDDPPTEPGKISDCVGETTYRRQLGEDCGDEPHWFTCLQAFASGFIHPDDLCPRCTCDLMEALRRYLAPEQTLKWQRGYVEKARAWTAPAGPTESTSDS